MHLVFSVIAFSNCSGLILKSFSRKAKIINNKRLNDKEMESIIDRLFACENPKYSPDGELNFVELDDDKIKNLF